MSRSFFRSGIHLNVEISTAETHLVEKVVEKGIDDDYKLSYAFYNSKTPPLFHP